LQPDGDRNGDFRGLSQHRLLRRTRRNHSASRCRPATPSSRAIEVQASPTSDDALRDGFSTANSLGLGLPGARRLMDDFEIQSTIGEGTVVTMKKWVR
jgi:hypothetical protein